MIRTLTLTLFAVTPLAAIGAGFVAGPLAAIGVLIAVPVVAIGATVLRLRRNPDAVSGLVGERDRLRDNIR